MISDFGFRISDFGFLFNARTTFMTSLATLALGVALFGLFFALVVACDHL